MNCRKQETSRNHETLVQEQYSICYQGHHIEKKKKITKGKFWNLGQFRSKDFTALHHFEHRHVAWLRVQGLESRAWSHSVKRFGLQSQPNSLQGHTQNA